MSSLSFRRMIALPILIAAMVAIPAMLLSFTSGGNAFAQGSTISPINTPTNTPATVPVATATPAVSPLYPINTCYYIVRPGDTLSAIALRAKTTVSALMQLNGIANPNRLLVGQRLLLPRCAAGVVMGPLTAAPTATPTAQPDAVNVKGYGLKKVIGNRLTPVLYGYTDNGWLFRTPDNGVTWMLITTRPAVEDFVMSPAEPNVLFSGVGQDCTVADGEVAPMYKSVNGGMTFVELTNARNLKPLLAHGVDKNILFAGDCTSPYLTTDGGFTWLAKMGGSESVWASYDVMEMVASQFVGEPKPEEPNWDYLYAVGTDKDGNSIVVFTNDSGNTWENFTPKNEATMLNTSSIDSDPMVAGKLWTADSQGIWAKAGVDESWEITFTGLQDLLIDTENGPALKLNDVIAHENGNLYLATVSGLYMLSPGSTEWVKIEGGSFDDVEIFNIVVVDSDAVGEGGNVGLLWLNTANGVYSYMPQ